jgi:hypothetical protein
MNNASGGTQPVLAAVLAFGIMLAESSAAQQPTAESFILPTTDKQCDQFNRSWVVASQHTYLSIKVRVWWTAVGAKEMEEEIVLSPGASRAIGCASELKIVSAEILQF